MIAMGFTLLKAGSKMQDFVVVNQILHTRRRRAKALGYCCEARLRGLDVQHVSDYYKKCKI